MEHGDPIWGSKIDPKCTQSKILPESENRALAAARALPELGRKVRKRPFFGLSSSMLFRSEPKRFREG